LARANDNANNGHGGHPATDFHVLPLSKKDKACWGYGTHHQPKSSQRRIARPSPLPICRPGSDRSNLPALWAARASRNWGNQSADQKPQFPQRSSDCPEAPSHTKRQRSPAARRLSRSVTGRFSQRTP